MFNRSKLFLLSLLAISATLNGCPSVQPPVTNNPPSPEPSQTSEPPPSSPKPASPTPTPQQPQFKNRVKVYFPKTPESNENFSYVEPVWRNTNSDGVAQFAIAQLLEGPTSQEQQVGLVRAVRLKDASNCGSDFKIEIAKKVAQLQFCRTVVSGGVGDDARALSALNATLKQFPTVDSAVILDKNGNCLGDGSGDNRCLANLPRKLDTTAKLALTSLGPVRVGMTPEEASRAAGTKIVEWGTNPERYCLYYRPEGEPKDVSFMVVEGRIARIDIDTRSITTLGGAKIGDSEARIRALYPGQIKAEPHEYVSGGKYLIFVPRDSAQGNYRVVFETDASGIVTRLRSGKLPEVKYVEGCA
ncbi:GerMN domain-containing protein [Oscillatoria sp. FACHB-1406]|uniref:GerMN domain-containing protein n=1 Tax=Oscillatoria sp. FACHB-1406 TaxID=2692846 RepID=UPI001684BA6C|nr:GerMN domain-containing protein [Oscillatoria sp. FACHB-1406]MBD2578244.1 GerMN domain-containing protein [Oscillatoria sp. FACHB-1406]